MTSRTRSRLFVSVNLAIGVAAFAWLLVTYGESAFALLRVDVRWAWLAAFVAAAMTNLLLLGLRWRGLMVGDESRPRFMIIFSIRSVAHAVSVLVPSGMLAGDPLRAWLVTRERLPLSRAVASTLADRVLEIGVTTPFSIFFALVLVQAGVPGVDRAGHSIALGAAALGTGVVWSVRRLHHGSGLVTAMIRRAGADRWRFVDERMNVLVDTEREVLEISRSRRRIACAIGLGVLSNLVVVLEFWLLSMAFDLPSDAIAVVAAVFATGAARLLPVPLGVGVLEGAQIWIFQLLGYPVAVGLAVALAVRLRELSWVLPGLVYFLARPALFRLGATGEGP